MRRAFIFFLIVMLSFSVSAYAFANQDVKPPAISGNPEITVDLSKSYGPHYPFPNISDWKSLRIFFARTPCFGWCPVYRVEITGQGSVQFNGIHCVDKKGRHGSSISQEKLRALFEAFERSDFFSLKNEYSRGIMDAPGVAIRIKYDHWQKEVVDEAMTNDMPLPAALLPDLIDKSANTAAWIGHPTSECMKERWP